MSMLRKFMIVASAFFAFEIIVHGVIPLVNMNSTEEYNAFEIVFHQAYDFLINISLLIIFRPRVWPDYFNLGVLDILYLREEMQLINVNDEEVRGLAPLI